MPPADVRTFVDRGGTYTDVVTLRGGQAEIRKVRSDVAVVGHLAEGALCFGTTVATNALLERRVVPSLLVVSDGFADLPRIGDMTRPELFDPDACWPDPLCARVIEAGAISEPAALAGALEGMQSVAVALLGSAEDGSAELEISAALGSRLPTSLGHRLSPELGYLARVETAVVDAAVTPVLHRAMVADAIPEAAEAMRSDGTRVPASAFCAPDAVLSGPAGGVLAVHAIARSLGAPAAVGFDMGGTSTDVCLVEQGALRRRTGTWRVGAARLRRSAFEVETIAAGGGSILGFDGMQFTVGPRSAGADPGPQVFGRGGPPTLTDAAVAAGLVDPSTFDPPIHPDRVSLPGPAESFLAVGREAMAAAVRRLALARGVDLREAVLVSFGGAAGQHACAVAEAAGIRTVVVHVCASVLSAWGQAFSARAVTRTRACAGELVACWPRVEEGWRVLAQQGSSELDADGGGGGDGIATVRCTVDLRAVGTDHLIEIAASSPEEALAAFLAEHRRQFGFDRRELAVEVVNVRVVLAREAPALVPVPPWPEGTPERVDGPARVALSGTTVVVGAGWVGVREGPLFRLSRVADLATPSVQEPGSDAPSAALRHALWGARFAGVAQEAGEVLRRLARSVSIRERLDFSCAVFDGEGSLVANAPHVPVHLGAMGETVRDLIRHVPSLMDGDTWLTNDPQAGGSHLPDLTVVQCVERGGERCFVASRAHHVDVGGITPGSMPSRSRALADEGLVFRRWPLVCSGRFHPPPLGDCRQPDTVLADLRAQVAANRHAATALGRLGEPAAIRVAMRDLLAAAERVAALRVAGLRGEATDLVEGVPLRVRMDGPRLDFSGTGGPHSGNLNAPRAVSRAAVIYLLRCLCAPGLPMNEGLLRAVEILLPPGSILDPPPGAAVVGGNVETSQRLVDLLFAALGLRAASAGSMSNLTLGGDGWAFYETLGGGTGASAAGPGPGARQVHMTNTRATDPEALAARLPLRVVRFAVRRGSGGRGRHAGGDGLVREIEVRAACTASLLAAWRPEGAPGLAGGGPGAPGFAELCCDATWRAWRGEPVQLAAGDRVRVSTPGGGGFGEPSRRAPEP